MKDIRNELIKTNKPIIEISKESKVSRQTIYNIINGSVMPKIPTVKSLCIVLKLDPKEYIIH